MRLWYIAFLFIVVAGCADNQVRVGFIGPLSGDLAAYGQTEQNAVELALRDIEEQGGQRLEIIYEDGKCDGKSAAAAASKLVNIDRVAAILGGACSTETLAAAPITQSAGVLLFSSFSSSPAVSSAGSLVFRNAPSDAQGGAALANLVMADGHRRVAVLSEQTDFALALKDVFRAQLERQGGVVVEDWTYDSIEKDYRSQLLKIRESDPDAVLFNPQSGISGGLAVKQAREIGIVAPLYGNMAFGSADARATGESAISGLKYVDAPGLGNSTRAIVFMQNYVSAYGEPASDYEAGARYDSVRLVAEAIDACGKNTTCMAEYLIGLSSYEGIIGTYSFDEHGDVVGIEYETAIVP